MMAWIKAHPWATGGIVFVIGFALVLILTRKGGSKVPESQGPPVPDAAAMQLGLQSQALQTAAQSRNNELAASKEIAEKTLAYQQAHDELLARTANAESERNAALQSENLRYNYTYAAHKATLDFDLAATQTGLGFQLKQAEQTNNYNFFAQMLQLVKGRTNDNAPPDYLSHTMTG